MITDRGGRLYRCSLEKDLQKERERESLHVSHVGKGAMAASLMSAFAMAYFDKEKAFELISSKAGGF